MSKIFKSEIYQENGIINATQLYKDIEDFIQKEKEEKAKILGVDISQVKLHRHHPLQHILNSTSGNYVSPTSMKSFEMCPAGYLYNKLVPEVKGSATSIGSIVHKIFEIFYSSDKEKNEDLLYKCMNDICNENEQDISFVQPYIDGYINSYDYLEKDKTSIETAGTFTTATEEFIKPVINPLGVSLNIPIYLLVDRIDVRKDGIYVLDYKTGLGDPNPYLLGENGYLPQMIFYKWGVEAEYQQKVNKVFLCLPGASTKKYVYTEMNVDSLVEQSKVIEKIFKHLDHIRKDREEKRFESSIMRYCGSCQMKTFCSTYIKEKELYDVQGYAVKNIIPVEVQIPDINYQEDSDN